MSRRSVQVLCDVDCEWEGLPPNYRVYVNDELFAERTWIWTNERLEELLQISAEPGEYSITYELVPPHLATLKILDIRVVEGSAEIIAPQTLKIN